VRTALIGAVLGAALGYAVLLLAYPVFFDRFDLPRNMPIQLAVGLYYGIPAALVAVGAVAAVRIHLRDVPHMRSTANAMSVLVPLAGLVITPVTMAFAWTAGYSTSAPVALAETALVAGALAGATVLARRWSLREPAEERPLAGHAA